MGIGSRFNASMSLWSKVEPEPLKPFNKFVVVAIILVSAIGFLNELYLGRPPNVFLLIGLFAIFLTATFFLLRSEGML